MLQFCFARFGLALYKGSPRSSDFSAVGFRFETPHSAHSCAPTAGNPHKSEFAPKNPYAERVRFVRKNMGLSLQQKSRTSLVLFPLLNSQSSNKRILKNYLLQFRIDGSLDT